MYSNDLEVVRALAKRVEEISALPIQQENINLWKKLNAKTPDRPMVMIDQIPWHEFMHEESLKLKCEDLFLQEIENQLRRIIYKWNNFGGDMVVRPQVSVWKSISLRLGMPVLQNTASLDPNNSIVGYEFFDQLNDDKDINNIIAKIENYDDVGTKLNEEKASEALGDILQIKMVGVDMGFALWDYIVQWHKVENALFDIIDRPEFVHKILDRTTKQFLYLIDELENSRLLEIKQDVIHCTGAFTDELYDNAIIAKNAWTYGMSQIFSTVSPSMHEEFEYQYLKPIFDRYGLVYYGCCEPLHDRIEMIRKYDNVRKISISPWSNKEIAAEKIGRDYVFSNKPTPALLCESNFNINAVIKDVRETVEICKKNNCPLELILKDISTACYDPKRLKEWNKEVMNIVKS